MIGTLTYLYLTLGWIDCYVYYDGETYEVKDVVPDPYTDVEQDLTGFNPNDYEEEIREALVQAKKQREKTIAQLAKTHLVT